MTAWLIVNIFLWVSCYMAYDPSKKTLDKWRASLSGTFGILGALSTIGYFGTAIWIHRFL